MNHIVVGVDAGGTKTRVIVSRSNGEQLVDMSGPGTVMAPGDAEHCAAIIAEQVQLALTSAESQYKPKVLYAGVAGSGREAEQIALQEALMAHDLAEDVIVESDASVAFADAFGELSGVLLIAGSGSIAFGRSPGGIEARCGGWGLLFGDEGSGAWIGRRALSVVASAHDGREPTTALTGAILTAAQVNEPEQLIPWALAANKEALAALAPSVVAVAMQEDLRANAIIDMAVEELVLHIRALGKRLFIDERAAFDLAFAGGLLVKGSLIRKRLERRLKTAVPGATLRVGEVIGARGAVKLAIQIVSPKDPLAGLFKTQAPVTTVVEGEVVAEPDDQLDLGVSEETIEGAELDLDADDDDIDFDEELDGAIVRKSDAELQDGSEGELDDESDAELGDESDDESDDELDDEFEEEEEEEEDDDDDDDEGIEDELEDESDEDELEELDDESKDEPPKVTHK